MSNKYYPACLLEIFHHHSSVWLCKQLHTVTPCGYFQTLLSVSHWGVQGMGSLRKQAWECAAEGQADGSLTPKGSEKLLDASAGCDNDNVVYGPGTGYDNANVVCGPGTVCLSLGGGAIYEVTHLALTN